MNTQDFSAGALDTQGRYCLGAIFATSLGSGPGIPQWIVGDSFLKVSALSKVSAPEERTHASP